MEIVVWTTVHLMCHFTCAAWEVFGIPGMKILRYKRDQIIPGCHFGTDCNDFKINCANVGVCALSMFDDVQGLSRTVPNGIPLNITCMHLHRCMAMPHFFLTDSTCRSEWSAQYLGTVLTRRFGSPIGICRWLGTVTTRPACYVPMLWFSLWFDRSMIEP